MPEFYPQTETKGLPRAAIKPLPLDFVPRHIPDKEDRKFVTALARGLDILKVFETHPNPISNKEIASITNMPKATVTRLTYTLMEIGYLRQNKGKYELSPAILTLGYPMLSSSRVRHVAHDHMEELARIGSCTVALAAPDQLSMVYVDECCGNSSTTLRVDIGARIEMARSAIGRAYLAAIDDELRQQLFKQMEEHYADEWDSLHQGIESARKQISEQGFCLVDREWRKDTRTIATPLISPDGKTIMAMNCGAATFSMSRETLEQDFGPRLVHIARTTSFFLGES